MKRQKLDRFQISNFATRFAGEIPFGFQQNRATERFYNRYYYLVNSLFNLIRASNTIIVKS